MRRITVLAMAAAALALGCEVGNPAGSDGGSAVLPAAKGAGQNAGCTAIQEGVLQTSDGQVIQPGYDEWGYNYQARLFNGGYCDAYRDAAWCQPYRDDGLSMKWNHAWLDNLDCDGNGLLDRHFGLPSYIGSGAWLTNHMSGGQGAERWTYFVKIVAAPADAVLTGGVWYSASGDQIGPLIWGEFAIIQEVESGSGILTRSPVGPGFGKFKP